MVGIDAAITGKVNMEFYPTARAHSTVTQRLVEEVEWLGDSPLVILHPGGGQNPAQSQPLSRWPAARFVILGNHLAAAYGARIVLVGTAADRALGDEIAGMMAAPAANYCGQLNLSELGAMCEVADLYVGCDTGSSHVAAACGCQTLVIYGPTDPAQSLPYSTMGNVHAVWRDLSDIAAERPFSWEIGVTAGKAIAAADGILRRPADRERTLAILSGRRREKN